MADLSVMGFLDEDTQQETEYNLKDAQARQDIAAINGKIPSAASSSNKLVDTTAMDDAIGQAVSAAYKPAGNKTVAELTSSLLVAANRGKVYNMTNAGLTTADFVEGAGNPIRIGDDVGICEPTTGTFKFNILSGFIAVDTNPTQSSANPVSSGGVYSEFAGIKDGQSIDSFADVETALEGKVDKVTGKGLSTNDYNNTAKGIVDNIQSNVIANTKLIKDTVGWSGKNWLKVDASSKTDHDVAYTVNNNGSVKANGTGNGYGGIILSTAGISNIPAGNYIASTGAEYQEGVFVRFYATRNGQAVTLADVNGTEQPITIQDGDVVNAYLTVGDGRTASNKMFYPMIRSADILDDTFEPYFGSTAFPRSEQAVLGAKNINGTKYITDTVFTVNSDGSVTGNVENSPTNYTNGLGTDYYGFVAPFTGQVKLTGGVNANFHIFAWDVTDNSRPYKDSTKTARWTSADNQYGDTPQSFYMIEGHTYQMVIRIMTGTTVNNVTMYPMLVLDSETDLSYVAPAMTNKQLTDKVVFYYQNITKNGLSISGSRQGNIVIISFYDGTNTEAYNSNDSIVALSDFDKLFSASDIFAIQTEILETYGKTARLYTVSGDIKTRSGISANTVIRGTLVGVIK